MRIQSGRLEHTRQDLRIAGCGRVSRLQALNRETVIAEQRYISLFLSWKSNHDASKKYV